MNSFFDAQFNYFPLIWTLHSHKNNNKIKHLHEKCLRLIFSDKISSYENLLEKHNSVLIHHKYMLALATKMFKAKQKLCPEITGKDNNVKECKRMKTFSAWTMSIDLSRNCVKFNLSRPHLGRREKFKFLFSHFF